MKPGDQAYEALCATLREEAAEQVERIGSALLKIEQGVDAPTLTELLEQSFREAHNLKGAAGSLGFSLASQLAHAIESVLGQLKTQGASAGTAAFDILHRALSLVDPALSAGPDVHSDPAVTPIIEQLEAFRLRSQRPTGDAPLAHQATVPPEPGADAPEPEAPVQLPMGTARAAPRRHAKQPTGTLVERDSTETSILEPAPAEPPPPAAEPARPATTKHQPRRETRTKLGTVRTTKPATTPGPAAPRAEENLRVSMRKLNALMAQVGELLAARLRTDQRLSELRSVLGNEEEFLDSRSVLLSTLRDRRPAVLDAFTQQLLDTVEEGTASRKKLVRELRELVRSFEADALHSTILSGELQEDIRRIQTFPLASVLDPLPRAVRNMAREVGKDAVLEVEGSEIELDKKVLEALRDPLNHLLRNAVDHGIESPAERVRAGKPRGATITIRAEHRGDSILLTVADDGPGVDLDAVLERAVEKGLIGAAEAEHVSEQRLLELLFAPGFTTRSEAGSLSGRGVGLDSVRTNIEELQGVISVDSRPQSGTTFTIVLPLTIYVVHALILRVGTHRMAMPISSIQRILRILPSDILLVEQSEAVLVEGRPLALVALGSLLGIEGDEAGDRERVSVLVVGAGEARCALAVDEIIGDQTVLAKNFEPPLVRVKNFAGATIRGDGTVLLMLNPIDLLRSANAQQYSTSAHVRGSRPAEQKPPRVLLVDDSLTTRSLERSVFELAGFEVVAAADGEEALEILSRESEFDVIVSDVSMPGISGFELCERVRRDERHRATPLVLVTALASDEDRRRGLDAGADAYIAKQEFDHEVLVSKVCELMGKA